MSAAPTSPLALFTYPRGPRTTTPRLVQRLIARLRHTRREDPDAGFSLLEVLVSFVIFAVVSTGAMYGITRSLDASHDSQQRVDAANVAQSFIAQAIATANTISTESGKSVISNVGNGSSAAEEEFTVIRWVTFSGGATTCTPGKIFTVNVEVHQAQTNKYLARSDTSIACPPA